VVLDSTDVFWADPGGYVIGMPVDRTGGTHLLARLDAMATGLALDATSVYAQTATSVLKLARASGVVRTLASDQAPRGIAVDGAYVYWLSVKARAEVRRMSLARGTGEVLAELDEAPLRIALDDQNVYVLGKADVLKLPKCQTGQVVLASTSGLGGGLAVDAGYVYWSDGEVIQRTPRDGGSVETVTNAAPLGDQFVVSDSFIYWGGGSGVVVRMPASGGAPQVIADGLTAPVVYAVDAHSVYFVDTNEIRKVDR
jgi:hypothetical protein